MAYWAGSGYHATARPFVVVSLPKTEQAARTVRHKNGKGGYLPVTQGSRLEAFVYILGHSRCGS